MTSDAIAQLATKALKDLILLRQLSDRIYQLMQEEIRHQRERSP